MSKPKADPNSPQAHVSAITMRTSMIVELLALAIVKKSTGAFLPLTPDEERVVEGLRAELNRRVPQP